MEFRNPYCYLAFPGSPGKSHPRTRLSKLDNYLVTEIGKQNLHVLRITIN